MDSIRNFWLNYLALVSFLHAAKFHKTFSLQLPISLPNQLYRSHNKAVPYALQLRTENLDVIRN